MCYWFLVEGADRERRNKLDVLLSKPVPLDALRFRTEPVKGGDFMAAMGQLSASQ